MKLEVGKRSARGGLCEGDLVINDDEIHLFKESKPFDISEYEFSDKDISKIRVGVCGDLDLILVNEYINIGKLDAEAIAKHFKLI